MMTPEQAGEAKEFWEEFGRGSWPEHLKIIGDYKYAWGTEWSGFLLLETEDPQTFFEFWPIFRDRTRWYIDNTRTVISVKREARDWMKNKSKYIVEKWALRPISLTRKLS